MEKSKEIQLINYSGQSNLTCCKTNHISFPEAFDDYKINIIDLSDKSLWKYKGADPKSINSISDINIISNMIQSTESIVLIILPQNITYFYDWYQHNSVSGAYELSKELKNLTSLVDLIIDRLVNIKSEQKFIMYNKTKTKINEEYINSDFVFNELGLPIVTKADNGKCITTCQYCNVFFTTLDLAYENYKNLLDYLGHLNWIETKEDEPNWFKEEKFFNDEILISKQSELENELDEINEKIKQNKEMLDINNYYKSILYKSGDNLVEVVNKILDEMLEYDYNNFIDINKEDFLIEKPDCVFIGEIKGINTNVKKANVTQTATHSNLYLDMDGNENKNVCSLLIVNSFRDRPVCERDKVNDDVVKLAQINQVLIITSEVFLKLFEYYKENKISRMKILELLKNRKGILEENDFITKE